jgi:hypothetical protein
MEMFWNFRRRPSRFATFIRSFLMVGAAVGVPVGIEVIRRMVRAGRSGATHGLNGRGGAGRVAAAPSRQRSRRRRPAMMERT